MKSLKKICENCGKVFYKDYYRSIASWGKAKLCSAECHNVFRRGKPSVSPSTTFKKGHKTIVGKKLIGKLNHRWKGGPTKKVCKSCQKVFQVWKDRLNAKTCSLKCNKFYRQTDEFRTKQSKAVRAVTSKIYMNSKTLRNLLRKCSRYAIWREKVLKKDDYTCQKCGKRGGKIQADHIKPFIKIILENNIKTYKQAMICEELWNTKNGQTLCLKCHYKTSTFGSKVHRILTTNTKTK